MKTERSKAGLKYIYDHSYSDLRNFEVCMQTDLFDLSKLVRFACHASLTQAILCIVRRCAKANNFSR